MPTVNHRVCTTIRMTRTPAELMRLHSCFGHIHAERLKRGILQESTSTYTPQLNKEVERANRTFVEAHRAMLLGGKITEGFGAEAMKCFVFVYNLTPSKRLTLRTPWEVFTNKPKPSLPPFYFGERVLY